MLPDVILTAGETTVSLHIHHTRETRKDFGMIDREPFTLKPEKGTRVGDLQWKAAVWERRRRKYCLTS